MTTWTPLGDLRVGIDLVSVEDVANSVARFGQAYLERVFTPHELASTRPDPRSGDGRPAADGLAARFAAKEAVLKVLRPGEMRPDWHTIEIRRLTDGWCDVVLTGTAADLAYGAGLEDLGVSITHEGQAAAAVAVGRCRSAPASVAPGTSGEHMSDGGAIQAPEEHEVGR